MRLLPLAVVTLAACTNGSAVDDARCEAAATEAACQLCCVDQGYDEEVSFDGDCTCNLVDVGDDPGDFDL